MSFQNTTMNTIICRSKTNNRAPSTLRSRQAVMAVAKDNQQVNSNNSGAPRMYMLCRRETSRVAETLPAKRARIVVRKRRRGNGHAKIQMNSLLLTPKSKDYSSSVVNSSSRCKWREKIKFMAKCSQARNKRVKRLRMRAVSRDTWWLTFRAKLE